MDTFGNFNAGIRPQVIGAMSLFSHSNTCNTYLQCFYYIIDEVEKSPERAVPFDNLRDGIIRIFQSKNLDSLLTSIDEDGSLPTLSPHDISDANQKISAASRRLLTLFESRDLISETSDYDKESGRVITNVHIKQIGRELHTFFERTKEMDKPSFNSDDLSSIDYMIRRILTDPEFANSPEAYGNIIEVRNRFCRVLDNLDVLSDECRDMIEEYLKMEHEKNMSMSSDWIEHVFHSPYFMQYLSLLNDENNIEYGNFTDIRRMQKAAKTLLSEEYKETLQTIVMNRAKNEAKKYRLGGQSADENSLYPKLYENLKSALAFLSDKAGRQYNIRSERVEKEMETMFTNVRKCIDSLSSNGRLSFEEDLKKTYLYLASGHRLDGISNLFKTPFFTDTCSLQAYEKRDNNQENLLSIKPAQETSVSYDPESDIEAVNKFLRTKILNDRMGCHIKDIILIDPDISDYKWGVVDTLNRIIYFGQYCDSMKYILKNARPCYSLKAGHDGDSQLVTLTSDGTYLYPDIMIIKEEEHD